MLKSVSIQWLQSIESSLQAAYAELMVVYEESSHNEKQTIYMVLAKLSERLRTVHAAIIDVLQERIRFNAPSEATIAQTKNLTDQLQWLVQESKQASAILDLLSNIFDLINKTVAGPVPA